MVRIVDWLSHSYLKFLGFRGRHLETSAGTVHVMERRGAGGLPPVILQHGLSSRSGHFRSLLPKLTAHFSHIIVPDLLGHGQSSTPADGLCGTTVRAAAIESMASTLDEPAVVFGSSLGGYAAIHFASAHPDKVRGLFLISPAGAVMSDGEFAAMLGRFSIRTLDEAQTFMDRLFAAKMPLERWVRRIVLGQLNQPYVHGFIERMTDDDHIQPAVLARLTMPTRLYWGQQERMFTPADLEYFLANLPRVELARPEGWGHSPFSERPQDVADRLLDFATQVA
ncbi:MAG: alpha/beta hydrolase [Proteobacteria bacterium]|nr:alpha/beta hydrolase [Pseudomonadota bacterium]MCP4919667.1 alpha/beta hydrolase [Pseudomonadota bacterium]